MDKNIALYLQTTYTEINVLKQSPKSRIVLAFDTVSRQVCIIKYLQNSGSAVYERLKGLKCRLIPQVYYVYSEGGETVVIEEYIGGETLGDVIERKKAAQEPFSDEWIKDVLEQLCRGLALLHSRRIIHRDIKPGNIMVTNDGIVKLIDFDIARLYKPEQAHDTTYFGTRDYAAPEQFGFAQTDLRSDIYALGAAMQQLKPRSARLNRIIERATELDPKHRYQSCDEILLELGDAYVMPDEKERENIPILEIEIMLKQKLKLFAVPMPVQQRDYPFIEQDYPFYAPVSMNDDAEYDSEDQAYEAALREFDALMYAKIDEQIKDILDCYKIYQLKKYYAYQQLERNFYYGVNKRIEKLLQEEAKYFHLNLPDYLLLFECIPSFALLSGEEDRSNFHLWQLKHLEETQLAAMIKQDFLDRTGASSAEFFAVYAAHKYDVRIAIEEVQVQREAKKHWYSLTKTQQRVSIYNFNIDGICQKLFEELLSSAKYIIDDNPYLIEDVEELLQKSYLPQLQCAIDDKIAEILKFLHQLRQKS